jgi:hypothetical protein
MALMTPVALGLSGDPVHEPAHGRRQAISMAVTQRSVRDSATAIAHLTIWLGEIQEMVRFSLMPLCQAIGGGGAEGVDDQGV